MVAVAYDKRDIEGCRFVFKFELRWACLVIIESHC